MGLDAEQMARRSVPPSTMSLLGLFLQVAWALREVQGDVTSSFRVEPDGQGLDLVRSVLGEPGLVEDVAGWNALVLHFPKPIHAGGG